MSKLDLEKLKLLSGSHDSRESGVCVMEAVAWFANEPHSDHPACVSPVIGAFLRQWNDSLDAVTRQKLKPYVKRVVGTNTGKEDEERRAWLATDWLVRSFLPVWLRSIKLSRFANDLEAMDEIKNDETAKIAQPVIDRAKKAAYDSWSAARSAAESAAYSAARIAAESAAESAARSAAYSAARSAAYSAARIAAESAAESALKATVKVCQKFAFGLLNRMIAVSQ